MKKHLSTLSRHLSNLPGWRTKRKIVVIESDDWGSIRIPSIQTFHALQEAGLDMTSGDSHYYNQNDTLASAEDLEALFETLRSIKRQFGKQPVLTAVSLSANPDFEKIKASGFREYHYEPFTTTLQRYAQENAFSLWQQGQAEHLFVPEMHGREHLNVAMWMRALQAGDPQTLLAFERGCWGFKRKAGYTYQAAFYLDRPEDLSVQAAAIKEGAALFQQLHGYSPQFFVTTNGPINNKLHKVTSEAGIQYISGSRIQKESIGYGKTKTHYHWLGQGNQYGQRYITRNVFFEPGNHVRYGVDSCLRDISIAFKWHKPVVISSHRVNYIGSLQEKNRREGLQALQELLSALCKRWPEVEFMTSVELGNLII